jgi:hypothetical protein
MARLTLPSAGTVVHVEGDLEDVYRSGGWIDVPPPVMEQAQRSTRIRPKKSE